MNNDKLWSPRNIKVTFEYLAYIDLTKLKYSLNIFSFNRLSVKIELTIILHWLTSWISINNSSMLLFIDLEGKKL